MEKNDDLLIVGRTCGLYGVRGWLRVSSETQPMESILRYRPWLLKVGERWTEVELEQGRPHGKGLIVKLQDVAQREAAEPYQRATIAIRREQLIPCEEGEYYWADLIGLEVLDTHGVLLGKVDYLLETGANDVLVVKGETEVLIPFIQPDVIVEVNLQAGKLIADWDPEF